MGDQSPSLESVRWHVESGRERRVDREAGGLITPRESRFREEIGQFRKYVRAVSVLLSRDGREGGR